MEKVYLEIRGGYKECIGMLNGLEKTWERKVPEREHRWQLAEETVVYGVNRFYQIVFYTYSTYLSAPKTHQVLYNLVPNLILKY